jgi:hypothetical protein
MISDYQPVLLKKNEIRLEGDFLTSVFFVILPGIKVPGDLRG